MNSTWNLLKGILEQNKKELIRELSREFIEDELLRKTPYGCCGRLKNIPGIFYVNCSRSGNPCIFTGRGVNNKSHYYWIPIVYKDNKKVENFIVSFFKEDLDPITGNTHHDFTEIQIVKNLYGSPEIGGAYNPLPKKDKNTYIIKHQLMYSYPSIVYNGKNNKPWGYDIKDIPVLDMKDESYSSEKTAKFIWKLIVEDINQNKLKVAS